MKKYLLVIIIFSLTLQIKAQTVSDADGNTYNTVTIGTQTWLKENLKTTKYNDGNSIPNVTDDAAWSNLTTPAYCWNNNNTSYKTPYGALYNWYTINIGNLCPTNWHVPSDTEWIILADFLGGDNVAGGKMKETGTIHWTFPNTGADNSSNFTAVAGGLIDEDGAFWPVGDDGYWWSSKEHDSNTAFSRHIGNYSAILDSAYTNKKVGRSVRCIKGLTDGINKQSKRDFRLYPNPATDKLYVTSDKPSGVMVTIYDLQGKQIINTQTGINSINISSLQNGIYIVKIIDSGKTVISQLIKE